MKNIVFILVLIIGAYSMSSKKTVEPVKVKEQWECSQHDGTGFKCYSWQRIK